MLRSSHNAYIQFFDYFTKLFIIGILTNLFYPLFLVDFATGLYRLNTHVSVYDPYCTGFDVKI